MRLADRDEMAGASSVDTMEGHLRSLAAEGLPTAGDAAEAKIALQNMLAAQGLDFRRPDTWIFLELTQASGMEDRRLAAMRWVLDLHACVPRRPQDAISSLLDALHFIGKHLQPTAGMMAYLNAQAGELAAIELRLARSDKGRLRKALAHVQSMDDPDTFRLPLDTTIAAAEVFGCLGEDGIALYHLGTGLAACRSYRTALLRHRDLIASGVATGLHRLFDHPDAGYVSPIDYVEHFRPVLSDAIWVDGILARLNPEAGASLSCDAKSHARHWMDALSHMGGWTFDRMERLLARADLLTDHPKEFFAAATGAIDHLTRYDAPAGVRAALSLLAMAGGRWDCQGRGGTEERARQCRKWVAGLRSGRDLLWLHERFREQASENTLDTTPSERWASSIARRIIDDRALARGTLLYLMSTSDQRFLMRVTPLIEGLLSVRLEHRFLWRLAFGSNGHLQRRACRFAFRIIRKEICLAERRATIVQGRGAGSDAPWTPADAICG